MVEQGAAAVTATWYDAPALEGEDSSSLFAGDLSPSNVVVRTLRFKACAASSAPRRRARGCLADKSAKRIKR